METVGYVYRVASDDHKVFCILDSQESVENYFAQFFCDAEIRREYAVNGTVYKFELFSNGARTMYAVKHEVNKF